MFDGLIHAIEEQDEALHSAVRDNRLRETINTSADAGRDEICKAGSQLNRKGALPPSCLMGPCRPTGY